MSSKITFILILFLFIQTTFAQDYSCKIDSKYLVVMEKGNEIFRLETMDAFDCIAINEYILIARGADGIDVYKINKEKKAEKISNIKTYGEVIGFKLEGNKIYATSAMYSQMPIILRDDGTLSISSITTEIMARDTHTKKAEVASEKSPDKETKKRIEGKVIEVTPGYAIINLGTKDGIQKNMRFEILSNEPVRTYNIKTGQYDMMPSLETTAISPVVQVSDDRCMIRIGRGNRAFVGDIAVLTEKNLSENLYTPSYEKNLHRIYGRIAPFIGIETLTIGSLLSIMYDHTFSFPLKIEAGLRNAGILFSTNNTSPFQIDLIPSYNTDLFEVGLGTGYSYSGHGLQRNFLFMQKVRLGAVDGISFTMWNSFIYQEKHSAWDIILDDSKTVGESCGSSKKSEYEFAWNSFDLEIATPVSKNINLFTHWAYSQAGWFSGEIGIKNFVKGNGGDGTLIIPVSIGGATVIDYKKTRGATLVCNPDTNRVEYEDNWNSEGFGGPIVSIGIDYRWR